MYARRAGGFHVVFHSASILLQAAGDRFWCRNPGRRSGPSVCLIRSCMFAYNQLQIFGVSASSI